MESEPLENTPGNPCVGCGPENPHGLRLAFQREGDAVTAALEAKPWQEGWPGRLHSAILYLALIETCNWTLYGLRGRVGLPASTSALDLRRWVATGEALRLTGRLDAAGDGGAAVRAEAVDAEGRVVAALRREFTLPGRAEFLEKMGYDAVPEGLEGALPDK